jgi:hypothetical protein
MAFGISKKRYDLRSDAFSMESSPSNEKVSIDYANVKNVLAYYSSARTETHYKNAAVPEAYNPKKDSDGNIIPYAFPEGVTGEPYQVDYRAAYTVMITTYDYKVYAIAFEKNEKSQCIAFLTGLEAKVGKEKINNKESVVNDVPETMESLRRFF